MTKTPNAIEELRAAIDPDGYRTEIENMKAELMRRAASLVANYDLNQADPNLSDAERKQANQQIEQVIGSLHWRVETINKRLAAFVESRDAVKAPLTEPTQNLDDAND
mgnify:CR=1 FL=1